MPSEHPKPHSQISKPAPGVKNRQRGKSRRRQVMLLGCDRLITLGITAVCDEAGDYQVCASHPAIPLPKSRTAPDLIVLGIVGLSEEESDLRFRQTCEHCPSLPLIVLQRDGASQKIPVGTRCAVGTNDTTKEWTVTFGAALAGGLHFGARMSILRREAEESAAGKDHAFSHLLSRTEMVVVSLTREGLMPGAIAKKMGRSVKTVEAHYQRIKMKLDMRSIGELRKLIAR